MKAGIDPNTKALRKVSLLETSEPGVRYYNSIVVANDVLYARAEAGDLEFLDRLRRLAMLAVELGGAPETCPAADLDSQAEGIKNVPAHCPLRGLPF